MPAPNLSPNATQTSQSACGNQTPSQLSRAPGKVRLTDDRVEQLITARSRRFERLAEEMRATVDVGPVTSDSQRVSHFYFTAVPTHGWPDMFSQYTSDSAARMRLLHRCSGLASDMHQADGDQRPTIAYAGLTDQRRTQRVAAGWVSTWAGPAKAAATGRWESMMTGRSATSTWEPRSLRTSTPPSISTTCSCCTRRGT